MAKEQWLYRSGFHQETHFLALSLSGSLRFLRNQRFVVRNADASAEIPAGIDGSDPWNPAGDEVRGDGLRRRHAVCLYDFEVGEEIKRLTNCKHNFHRSCLGRWMDHDQKTYLLCRTPFVPDEMQDEFNQRLWVVFGITKFYSEYDTVFGL